MPAEARSHQRWEAPFPGGALARRGGMASPVVGSASRTGGRAGWVGGRGGGRARWGPAAHRAIARDRQRRHPTRREGADTNATASATTAAGGAVATAWGSRRRRSTEPAWERSSRRPSPCCSGSTRIAPIASRARSARGSGIPSSSPWRETADGTCASAATRTCRRSAGAAATPRGGTTNRRYPGPRSRRPSTASPP